MGTHGGMTRLGGHHGKHAILLVSCNGLTFFFLSVSQVKPEEAAVAMWCDVARDVGSHMTLHTQIFVKSPLSATTPAKEKVGQLLVSEIAAHHIMQAGCASTCHRCQPLEDR